MSRRRASVVTVVSGGLSLSLAACAGKDGAQTQTTNPPVPAPVEPAAGEKIGEEADAARQTGFGMSVGFGDGRSALGPFS